MPSILLHTCCGPCSIYVVNTLRAESFDVTAFWYNPNVHPFREHHLRLEAVRAFAAGASLPLIVAGGYDMVHYFRAVAGHEREGDRCSRCFQMRLERTAQVAAEKGFDAFTTTLSISPYQRHDLLQQAGDEAAEGKGTRFLYRDFRPGFRESHRLSHEIGLYHQAYCGCVYSEYERYGKIKISE